MMPDFSKEEKGQGRMDVSGQSPRIILGVCSCDFEEISKVFKFRAMLCFKWKAADGINGIHLTYHCLKIFEIFTYLYSLWFFYCMVVIRKRFSKG